MPTYYLKFYHLKNNCQIKKNLVFCILFIFNYIYSYTFQDTFKKKVKINNVLQIFVDGKNLANFTVY